MSKFTKLLLSTLSLLFFFNIAIAQQNKITSVVGKLIRTSPKLSEIDKTSMYGEPLKITRDMDGIIGISEEGEEKLEERLERKAKKLPDGAVREWPATNSPSAPITTIVKNFDGLTWSGFDPSDNNLAVGANHVVQMINDQSGSRFIIWNKAGTVVQPSTVLASVTGVSGAGDPVVFYDQLANRWVLTEFGPSSCCNSLIIAVSVTADPTGAYKVYQYTDPSFFPDYPKFSVWHNAYYARTSDFNTAGTAYLGGSIYAFDRTAMLAGAATATMVRVRLLDVGAVSYYNMNTIGLDGNTPSSQGGLFAVPEQANSRLNLFEFTPNFTTPASSVVGPLVQLPIASFSIPPGSVAQQGSTGQIQTLGQRLMYRLSYRNRGGTESILIGHTVLGSTATTSAVRWYELRRVGGNWTVYQQGTLANPDGNSRLMPGIAMDAAGNIGLMYNVSGTTAFPSVKYTGRIASDPLGQMTLPEQTIINGTNAHTIATRWGDYNTLAADPTITGSFWSTAQYGGAPSGNNTRVANFTIIGGAAITTHPANFIGCAGGTANFSIVASGNPPIAYQWQVRANATAAWANIVGATATAYAFTTVAADNGKQFRCYASNPDGADTSNAATVTIITTSVGGTLTPAASTICGPVNSTVLTLSGSVGNIIRWEYSTDGGATYPNIVANTTNTLTATNITQSRIYRVVVQATGCTAVLSSTSTLTYVAATVGSLTISANQGTILCEGDPTLLTVMTPTAAGPCVTASGALGLTITDANATGISTPLTVSCAPAGAVLSTVAVTLNITHTWDSDLTIFLKSPTGRVINLVSGKGGSGDNFTNTVISSTSTTALSTGTAPFTGTFAADGIATNPPAGYTQTDATFTPFIQNTPAPNGTWSLGVRDNVGGDEGILQNWSLSLGYDILAPAPAGLTYAWSPAAGLSNTSGNPVAASPMVNTTYSVLVTNAAGCTGTASIPITVNKRPAITAQPIATAACVGSSADFTVGATGTGISYQWQVSTDNCTTYSNITGATAATLTLNPVTSVMNGNGYRCIVSGTCTPPATSNCVKLQVDTLPAVTITPAVSCGGVAGINGTLLTTGGSDSPPPIPGSKTVTSTTSVSVPDNDQAGATSAVTASGIPANATITGMSVSLNMTHTWNGDMVFALKAPNGKVLNLDYYLTATGGAGATTGFVNTVISSAGTTALSAGTGTYTGTFKPDAAGFASAPPMAPTGFATAASVVGTYAGLYSTPNGVYTLGMYDGGAGDNGTLTSWSLKIDYTTPDPAAAPITYTWSPAAGLYTNATATTAYVSGASKASVYAAPTSLTTYTVTAVAAGTGCVNKASAIVNYTPPVPGINPVPAALCYSDSILMLTKAKILPQTVTATSGAISVVIPDNLASGVTNSLPTISIPAGAMVTETKVTLNITHTWAGDMVIALKAPNGNILNLDYALGGTGGAGATTGFANTVISSSGTAALVSGSGTFTGTFKADAVIAADAGPTGFTPNVSTWADLYGATNPSGVYTLGAYDIAAGDQGTITNWQLAITYTLDIPSTPPVWTPIAGLFTNPAATVPYVAGTQRDTVYFRPSTVGGVGSYPYEARVTSLPAPLSGPTTNFAANNGNFLVTYNFSNTNAYPITLRGINSQTFAAGASTVGAFYKLTPVNGSPGAISAANGWTSLGTATITGTGAAQPFLTGLNLVIPANTTYGFAVQADGPGISYSTLAAGTYTFNVNGGVITTGTNIGYGGALAPAVPTFTPRGFIGSMLFEGLTVPACTSQPAKITIKVDAPISITSQPSNTAVCVGSNTTITTVVAGTSPSHRWQVSANNGATYTFIANGGVYSGATTATLSITGATASMNNYLYRDSITSAVCGKLQSAVVRLTVNPLPTVTIAASPYQKLFPGLSTTLFGTVTPAAATYKWLRNGIQVPGTTNSLIVNVDGLGDYTLNVTDVNGCSNTSNIVSLTDSASNKVFIYPTPNSGQFQVRYYSIINNTGLPRGVNVFDARGKRVLTKNYVIGAPYARMDVDLTNHGSGVYWIEVVDVNGNRLAMGRTTVLR